MNAKVGVVIGFVMAAVVASAALTPDQGVVNAPADGMRATNVAFVQRGGGNEYGYGVGRQYVTPIGLTILPWSLPNEISIVYGVRANLGFGRYEATYGVDVGAWSTSGAFGGIAANVAGNFVERDATGIQIGLVNLVEGEFQGIQIGVMNSTRGLKGMQVGLMNFNAAGIFFPLLNFGF